MEVGENIAVVRRDRLSGRGGGVAIAYDINKIKLQCYPLVDCPIGGEVIAAAGPIIKNGKKVLVVSVYLPPSLKKDYVTTIAECISNTIANAKIQHPEITVILAGDMNGKKY